MLTWLLGKKNKKTMELFDFYINWNYFLFIYYRGYYSQNVENSKENSIFSHIIMKLCKLWSFDCISKTRGIVLAILCWGGPVTNIYKMTPLYITALKQGRIQITALYSFWRTKIFPNCSKSFKNRETSDFNSNLTY